MVTSPSPRTPGEEERSDVTRLTGLTRCGVFIGPTLVANQWLDVDCGHDRGLLGR